MNALIVFSAVVAACQGQLWGAAPYALNYANAGLPYAANFAPYAAAPLPYAAAPAALPAPVPYTAPSSQFQAQDEFGNINYGYSNINSAKQEVGNAYGGVTGSYSYVDANGIPQRVDYIADHLGYRVVATNLPVGPAVPQVNALEAPVFTGVAPEPVQDTPEVAAAKAEFNARFQEEASREKREAEADPALLYGGAYSALPYYAGLNYANTLGYAGLNSVNALGYAGLNSVNTLGYSTGLPYAYNNLAYAGAPALSYAAAPALAYAGAPAPLAAAPALAYAGAPVATVASAPATRQAVLTKIQLNPGHAVAYRVD